jgi:hypothetical protein
MAKQPKAQSENETIMRRDSALARALTTPHKPQVKKLANTKPKKSKLGK